MKVRGWGIVALAGLLVLAGCGDGDGDTDGGVDGMDAAAGTDAGGSEEDAGGGDDAGAADDAGADTGPPGDAGPRCEGMRPGRCDEAGTSCECCPAGGPTQRCLCTTTCNGDEDCTDPSRPHCNRPETGIEMGICTPEEFGCAWGSICASPDTPIETPKGERPIADLREGDLVYSLHRGAVVPRPLIRVHRTAVTDHAVVHVALETGRSLEISAGHPTADGRLFADLAPGDRLDGVEIVAVRTVPYAHPHTHDVLPDSDTGTYVAGGVLIGSTLAPRR
ncbi:MAG TPA: Hint domain-containing protein [Sandaracinaceae bacterium LLY-WYZ-13_1]|nr:Hint domain-containing protein [Sandaracinaceae bacterium LLY-WYZ-13_1]